MRRSIALVAFLAACASSPPGPAPLPAVEPPGELAGTAWRLENLKGAPPVAGSEVTLEFTEPGKAAGRASCNRYFGSVEVRGEEITFSALGSTMMACDEALMNQEQRYLRALEGAVRYIVQDGVLQISGKDRMLPLRFTRMAP
jgi:heat shock protein HslJ